MKEMVDRLEWLKMEEEQLRQQLQTTEAFISMLLDFVRVHGHLYEIVTMEEIIRTVHQLYLNFSTELMQVQVGQAILGFKLLQKSE